jgi:hypothetical protein
MRPFKKCRVQNATWEGREQPLSSLINLNFPILLVLIVIVIAMLSQQ